MEPAYYIPRFLVMREHFTHHKLAQVLISGEWIMIRYGISLLIILTLSSCSLFQLRRPEIEQGNIITPQKVEQLHRGMSEGQVRSIMGEPVLKNIFSLGRVDYVYTYQKGNNPRTEKRVLCIFQGGRLVDIQRN